MYDLKHSTPLRWWYVCEEDDGVSDCLQELASKLFSITPHSASCERVFSTIGWFYGNRMTSLKIKKVEDMAKIFFYHKSNIKKELQYFEDVTHQELKKILQNFEYVSDEEDEEEDILSEEEDEDDYYVDDENINQRSISDLKIEEIINLNSDIFNNSVNVDDFNRFGTNDNSLNLNENYDYNPLNLVDLVDDLFFEELEQGSDENNYRKRAREIECSQNKSKKSKNNKTININDDYSSDDDDEENNDDERRNGSQEDDNGEDNNDSRDGSEEEDLEENNEKNDDKINRQTALTKKFQFCSRHQVVSYKE